MKEKLIAEAIELGCTSKRDAAIAAQVFLELSEVKQYWEVQFQYNIPLQLVYLTAKQTKSGDINAYIPIPSCGDVSFDLLEEYIQLAISIDGKSVCLVICSSDSNCTFYDITQDIVHPTGASTIKAREKEREVLNKTLLHSEKLLEQGAMYGIPITIPKRNTESTNEPNDDVESNDD